MFNFSNSFPSPINGFPHSSGVFFGHEKDGVHFNHHPFIAGDCSFDHLQTPLPIKASSIQNSDNRNHLNLSESVNSPSRKRVAVSKKDRHSKIFTAQGPRDRRVRLSIEISRKFFGLQDLLGFDKASKTLDWLFTKSKSAIKDLLEEKKHTLSPSTLTDQCEEVFMEKGDHVEKKGKKKKPVAKYVNGGKRKKKTTPKNPKTGFSMNLAARIQIFLMIVITAIFNHKATTNPKLGNHSWNKSFQSHTHFCILPTTLLDQKIQYPSLRTISIDLDLEEPDLLLITAKDLVDDGARYIP
ncbi:unnamed protein product [Lactuca saligna]|uniref:TCP domain-containing protein n=1 Tax=Lactuca saligna TaxID=75948 RepID=A0AA35YMV8_LACSI|nr:unnamed protein product [Lactuca saligna]